MSHFRVASMVAVLGMAITVGLMLNAGSPGDPSWWGGVSIFAAWALSPYVIVLLLARRWSSSRAAQSLLTMAALLVIAPVPYLFYDAFIAHPDALNGLVFMFLPMYQLVVVAALSGAAWWASRA